MTDLFIGICAREKAHLRRSIEMVFYCGQAGYAFDSARRDDYFSEYNTMESTFAVLAEALHGEIDQLNSLQRNVVLCEGECRGTFAGWTYYRFEAPEEIFSGR